MIIPGAEDWGGIFDGRTNLAQTTLAPVWPSLKPGFFEVLQKNIWPPAKPHRQAQSPQLTYPPVPDIRYIILADLFSFYPPYDSNT